MTNIVEQLFKSLDPWPGFQITSFKIQVSSVDGRKTLILDLRPVEGSMPMMTSCPPRNFVAGRKNLLKL